MVLNSSSKVVRIDTDTDSYDVIEMPDNGTCFFAAIARAKGTTVAGERLRLVNSRHLPAERKAPLRRPREYAQWYDMEAMAKELEATLVIFINDYNAETTRRHIMCHGAKATIVIHFEYMRGAGDGHVNLLQKR